MLNFSTKATKYIHKYIAKGPDRATVMLGGSDEVKIYLDSHWIGACEAFWRFMEYELHVHKPNIVRLPVHEENMQHIVFNEEDDVDDILNRNQQTKLTAYFAVSIYIFLQSIIVSNLSIKGQFSSTYSRFFKAIPLPRVPTALCLDEG
jgi:hypothetical protein